MLPFPVTVTAGGMLLIFHCFMQSSHAAPVPSTIPAVQQWTTGTGTCTFGSSSRIVVSSSDADTLASVAQTFADDLNGLLDRVVTVTNDASMKADDIFLKLGLEQDSLGDEGYRLSITTGFEISARTAAGIFYGTRTLLQLLKQGVTVDQGTIIDWPSGRWRGVMVDTGRKFYTIEWLQQLIRDIAYVKMNLFHFHLSDGLSKTNEGGFRLESTTHPEITSTRFYSKAEIQSLIDLAAQYHVTIVPEIDFPGHVNWLYDDHRNLLLDSRVLGNQYWALDLSNDSAYSFVQDIFEEFMPLFPGPFWHLGADEYMFIDEFASFPQLTTWAQDRYGDGAHANDCYRHFVNWANDIVKLHGKTTWAWNDVLLGITGTSMGACTMATDIWIDHWGALNWIGWGGVYPSEELSRGYNMINCSWDIYYILTTGSKTTGDPKWVFDNWALNVFAGGTLTAGDPHIKGGKYPIWGDVPEVETEEMVWDNTFMLARTVAQKCWGSPEIETSYSGFQTLANTIARAPTPVPTSTSKGMARSLFPRGIIFEEVQILDLCGRLIATFSADDFVNGDVITKLPFQGVRKRRLSISPCICRFKGKKIDKTVKIVLIR